jgi:hypothetical protein
VGRLQERYGIAREESEQRVRGFKKIVGQLTKSNSQLMQLQKSLHNKERTRTQRVRAARPPKNRSTSRSGN